METKSMNVQNEYTAPEVELLAVEVEAGFDYSNPDIKDPEIGGGGLG